MSNQIKKQIETHTGRPTTLAAAFGELIRLFGGRASDSDLVARWDEIMGADIASVAKIAAIKKMRDGKFNIVIRPSAPAFALELSYRKDEITEKINKYFGHAAVGKISFRK